MRPVSTPPPQPKIYHIVHVDRLASIVAGGYIWSDAETQRRAPAGTVIGMGHIKQRRLSSTLESQPGLHVGECVPFYFCPRSVMLYIIRQANHPELTYRGGQGPIIHLEADLNQAVGWATQSGKRWAFSLSNAGSNTFEDRSDLAQLDEIDWRAVAARGWRDPQVKEAKQAEFLVEQCFPWTLIERIGVVSTGTYQLVDQALPAAGHRPMIELKPDWYY